MSSLLPCNFSVLYYEWIEDPVTQTKNGTAGVQSYKPCVRLGHSAVLKCVGLFATRVFRKGDLIVPYMGRDEVRLTMHEGQIVHSAYTGRAIKRSAMGQ